MNYYNEFDKHAAQWLRNLIEARLIPGGHVDERDIRLVMPEDLKGYTQHHFFAGIGGWPLALQLAGWPEDRPIWTGSCPCQPFSCAGKQKGESDERHLWPEFRRLIAECQPPEVIGEQVASAAGRQWLARVRLDLEELGYAVGAADLCAASAGEKVQGRVCDEDGSFRWEPTVIGAPHIRQRLYLVATQRVDDSSSARCDGTGERPEGEARDKARVRGSQQGCTAGRLGDALNPGLEGHARDVYDRNEPGRFGENPFRPASPAGGAGGVADAERNGGRAHEPGRGPEGRAFDGRPGPWSSFDLVPCADGKTRRVGKRITFVVDGIPGIMATERPKDNQENEGEGEVDAETKASRSSPPLQDVRNQAYQKDVPKIIGRQGEIQAPSTLQQEVHGQVDGGKDQGFQSTKLKETIGQGRERGLREVPSEESSSQRTSHRRESPEQCSVQPDDVVRFLSSSLALGIWEREIEASGAMQGLLNALSQAGILPETLSKIPEIWRSASDEARQRVGRVLCERGAHWSPVQILTCGELGRVGKLRAYGNAIVPPLAVEFIKAYLEVTR